MARNSGDSYGSEGSVPAVQPSGLNAPQLGVRANPEETGAAIGQGVSKVGDAASGVANMYGGLVLETAANQAELGYIKDTGNLKAKYSQYEGLQAEAMRPQYEADLQTIHQQYRQNLPVGAQQMFDHNTIRSLGIQTGEYASYAAGQVKHANLSSNDALADASIAKAGNLQTALDPTQFGEANGTILHAANAVADIKGWSSQATGIDSETGKLTFGDDAQSQATKAQYDQYVAEKQSKLYLTAAKTIADNHGSAAAADWAQAHWNSMPDVAKVAMNQYLAPKIKNEAISTNIAAQNNQLDMGWSKQFTSNIPSSPSELAQKTPLDVIRQNEGYTGKVGKDSNGYNVLNGINEKSFPAEYTEAKRLLDTQGKEAADKYSDDFYQKNIIDKYGIKSLPPATQAIVADGLVNHGAGEFGQSLISAAKNGASPSDLLDMRRAEYNRLAQNPEYSGNLNGWLNRLDSFQPSSQGVYANKKDFLESQKANYVQNSVNDYLKQYPEDHYGAQLQEKRATAEINRKIAVESASLKSDADTIDKAIGGSFTKGKTPMTIDELKSIPGIQPVLEKVQREQGDFYNGIDTKIAKVSHGQLSQNSPNAYDAILSTLDTSGGYDRQSRIEYLSKGLGNSNPGYSISWKDFNDAKPAIDLDSGQDFLSKRMKDVARTNGNIDGRGQDRAVEWYNRTMAAWKQNQAKGDKAINATDFFNEKNEQLPAPAMPSRMQMISNAVQKQSQQPPQTATGANGEKYILQGGQWVKQ